jgi:hypothetical protein
VKGTARYASDKERQANNKSKLEKKRKGPCSKEDKPGFFFILETHGKTGEKG